MRTAISKLKQWCEEQETTPHAFALANGLDPSELSKVLRGVRQRINVTIALAIERGTDGAVRCEDWEEE